jgi:H2-forming N5,N10-methylenetetrahydromethanopterin dehydrogenase-like enzyme
MSKTEIQNKVTDYIVKMHGIDDLPVSMQNAIIEVLVEFYNAEERHSNAFIGMSNEDSKQHLIKMASLISKVEALPDYVNSLRNENLMKNRDEYTYALEFILDVIKYDIKNAHLKSGFRRNFERRWIKWRR